MNKCPHCGRLMYRDQSQLPPVEVLADYPIDKTLQAQLDCMGSLVQAARTKVKGLRALWPALRECAVGSARLPLAVEYRRESFRVADQQMVKDILEQVERHTRELLLVDLAKLVVECRAFAASVHQLASAGGLNPPAAIHVGHDTPPGPHI